MLCTTKREKLVTDSSKCQLYILSFRSLPQQDIDPVRGFKKPTILINVAPHEGNYYNGCLFALFDKLRKYPVSQKVRCNSSYLKVVHASDS